MENVLTEKDIMKQYTKLVANLIKEGRIMKGNRGSNSMYEFETHFEPSSSEFNSLIIALERKPLMIDKLGFGFASDVGVYDLVVKNIKSTFDDGEVIYSKRFFRLTDLGKYFYVADAESAKEIESKRALRWSARRVSPERLITSTNTLVDKVKHNQGFKSAKPEDLEFVRNISGYCVTNKKLKTKPQLVFRF